MPPLSPMAAAPMPIRTPDFLILGAAKAGTTALHHYLGQHPDVFFPRLRETNFFALEGGSARFSGPGDDAAVNRKAVTTWDAYTALFADAGVVRQAGECSPLYLYDPSAPERIARRLPGVKLIVLLRNPADRAYAAYLHLVRDGREPATSFEEGLAREAERIAAGWEHLWHYRAMGFYGEQLERYYRLFSPEQLLVLRYEAFQRDPVALVAEVSRFLGIDAEFEPDVSRRPNRSGIPKITWLYRLLAGPSPLRRLGRAMVPLALRGRLQTGLQQMMLDRPPMPAEVRAELLAGYRADADRLMERIGLDVSDWFTLK
ncbi:MAG: sulfotransferase [Rhodothermales bacterium]|nr:sulfotransferase [Rhodothermales bacterium]